MLINEWEEKICIEYRKENCKGCPLKIKDDDCHSNSHYEDGKWVADGKK